MKKSFLRKGTAALAAMLVSANVMAQSFDFTKEFKGDMEDMFEEGLVAPSLTKDGNLRLVLVEESEDNGETRDSKGNYCYTYKIDKLSILNNKLNTEKEFTSGPLFDEYVNVTVKSAAKTLKVESVDTVYSGDEALNRFYDYFHVYIYNEETDDYDYYNYSHLVEDFTEDEVRTYVNRWLEEERSYEDITFLGERFLFESYYVQESDYYDWGKQYPTEGWIYKDYDDVCKVRIDYTPDEYEEVSRYNSGIYCTYYRASMLWYTDLISEGSPATISQDLFNDDDDYEFLLPEMAVLERTSYSSYDGVLTTYYEHEPIGFKVVSEDGTVLQRLMVNEEKDNNMSCYAYVISLGNKNYLMVNSYKRTISESGYDYIYTDEVTRFYEIKKSGTGASIQKVREMRGGMNIRPTVANRDEQITITLDDNKDVARELIITGVNGQLVERRTIPAGENTIQMNAAMMRSGMYNFTLQKKGEVVDNGKVIVK